MTIAISTARALDVRFPTSRFLDGSDAMNPDPDYSAAYVILETTEPGLSGHGLAFTLGRGTDLVVHAINALSPKLVTHRASPPTARAERRSPCRRVRRRRRRR